MTYSFRTNGNFIDFVHTDNTSLHVENVVRTLHNTSRAIDWSLSADTTLISFSIDNIRYDNVPISEIDFDGTPMNSQDDFETGITAMFPGLAGGGEDATATYLVLWGTLNQSGTNNPDFNIIINQLGAVPVAVRYSPGYYQLESAGLFPDTITTVILSGIESGVGTANVLEPGVIRIQTWDLANVQSDSFLSTTGILIMTKVV